MHLYLKQLVTVEGEQLQCRQNGSNFLILCLVVIDFVTGKHYLIFDTITNSARLHRDLAERNFMAPVVTVSRADIPTINKWRKLLTLQVK